MGSDLVPVPGGELIRFDDPAGSAESVIEEWLEEADAEAAAIVERAHQEAAAVRVDAMAYALAALARAEEDAALIRDEGAASVHAHMDEAALAAEALRAEGAAEAREMVATARGALMEAYADLQQLAGDLHRLFDPSSAVLVSLRRATTSMAAICEPGARALPAWAEPFGLPAAGATSGATDPGAHRAATAESLPGEPAPTPPHPDAPLGEDPLEGGPLTGEPGPEAPIDLIDLSEEGGGTRAGAPDIDLTGADADTEIGVLEDLLPPEEPPPPLWRRLFAGRHGRRAA